MGYYATAKGECTLITTALPPKYMIVDIKNDLKENGSCMVDVSLFGGQLNLMFDGKYYGHEIKEDLKIIAKYITDGYLDFVGEDGERWRLKFENGIWNELEGRMIYDLSELTTEELVDELHKRGYNVQEDQCIVRIELKDISTIENLEDTLDEDIMKGLPTVEQYRADKDTIHDVAKQILEHPSGSSVIVFDEDGDVITCGDIESCIDTILDEEE